MCAVILVGSMVSFQICRSENAIELPQEDIEIIDSDYPSAICTAVDTLAIHPSSHFIPLII